MNKTIFKVLMLAAMVASLSFTGGCRSKPKATGWDEAGMTVGDPLGQDIPLIGDNFDAPADGKRDLFRSRGT